MSRPGQNRRWIPVACPCGETHDCKSAAEWCRWRVFTVLNPDYEERKASWAANREEVRRHLPPGYRVVKFEKALKPEEAPPEVWQAVRTIENWQFTARRNAETAERRAAQVLIGDRWYGWRWTRVRWHLVVEDRSTTDQIGPPLCGSTDPAAPKSRRSWRARPPRPQNRCRRCVALAKTAAPSPSGLRKART